MTMHRKGRYQNVEVKIWHDEKFISLSTEGKLLFLYVLTCPHSNALGAYILKKGYIVEDLKWPLVKVTQTLSELGRKGLVAYDEAVSLVVVNKYLEHNPPSNTNQCKNLVILFYGLPKSKILLPVSNYLEAITERFHIHFETITKPDTDTEEQGIVHASNSHETLSDPFHGSRETLSKPDTDTDTDTDTETEKENIVHESTDPVGSDGPPPVSVVKKLVNLWNEKAPRELPRVRLPVSPARERAIRSALKHHPLEWWGDLFESLRDCPFLLGRNDRGWVANIDFALRRWEKISEGGYREKRKKGVIEEWLAEEEARAKHEDELSVD